jgi:RHH-type proline utilization regulon transcriptional repressor/proline dehydrogenase/delta 1-pyrroline-5-carboxylate dehydrogenase
MKGSAKSHFVLPLPAGLNEQGTFVAPTVLEIGALSELGQEVFGPVLHVIRYRRADLEKLIDSINASGFGLTLGVHSRIDETINLIASRAHVGNIYVNRNIVGAVVGVQPFGGEGKSGTGPKAGGPLYIKRLQRAAAPLVQHERQATAGLDALLQWARTHGHQRVITLADQYMRTTLVGSTLALPGPTGERNTLSFAPRGTVLCAAASIGVLLNQLAAVLASGNQAVVVARSAELIPEGLPAIVKEQIRFVGSVDACDSVFQIALVESALANGLRPILAARPGAVISMIETSEEIAIPLWRLVAERALCINTTAAGGNASLMTLSM